jgi:Dockerin type I domain
MRRSVGVVHCVALAVAVFCCAPARAQTLQGDLNADGFVGALDLQIVLTYWGQTVTPGDLSKGDVFPDGFIGLTDLSFLLLGWGQGTIPTPGGDASLGINLSEVSYFSREWVFVDAVRSARRWVSTNPNGQPFDTGQTVVTDADGWPILQAGQAAQTLLLTTKAGYPAGRYNVTFDGSGTLAFEFDASNVQLVGPGQMTFDVNVASDNGILMRIVSSDPGDPVRNIRVWMPNFQNAQSSFHPLFIQKLQPFGVIRFMDWQQTNGSKLVSWSQRTTTSTFSQDNDNGVALEYMIELCNELGADAWFCMPHKADDDYVTQFATMVRDNLDPGLKIYIEWSNEVWNVSFPQHKWIGQQTGAAVFSVPWFQKWASEAANDFSIWQSVFAGQTDRLTRVAAGQAANVWVTQRLTDELAGQYDAISCAAYFDHRHAPFNAGTTVQDIIDNAINETIPNVYAGYYQDHGDLAQQRTNELGRAVALLAYEGGQHYTAAGNTSLPYFQAFKDVQTYDDPVLPDMYDAYTANLSAFDQAGGSLFMAYNYVGKQGPFGSWGHLQFQNETETVAPKYRALLDFSSK